ncbi:TonB-dependent receptor [Kineobactrum salinum]|uniref:TonB-dependent receptor n=1 Tax=Kineobactrum salinum TaxID=2708301 RepID=A0A6C0U5I2_9GAMM|nr:TonB-dependent receptor [Kineobactrum salinum]QIB67236.1 TonB-dependent receptor [Kineobactrum salinum]
MKSMFSRCGAAAVLLCSTLLAEAADELAVQVSQQGGAAAGLTVVLDGDQRKTLDDSGIVYFDLSAGGHSLQVLDASGTALYSLRFDSASGQLADVNIELPEVGNPRSVVESYFSTEAAAERSRAAIGMMRGQVSSGGVALDGATVTLSGGVTRSVETDASGRYELQAPRGMYRLTISHPETGTQTIEDYRVIANAAKESDFSLRSRQQQTTSIAAPSIEEVTVIGTMSTAGLQESERYATNVINTLDVEQLARFGDTDVAASVIRVPSVTIQDGQFVFIRGLGDRYVSSTLNGATLPSTNPTKRSVPLDLFPSSMVEQLDIRKSFLASMPGESTGGNLQINTRTFPSERAGKVSFQLGYVDGTTGKDAFVDPISGSFDALGWDDGARQRPAIAYAVAEALEYSEFYNDVVQRELGKLGANAIKDDFQYDTETATPDMSVGLSYGDVFDLESWGAELGYFAAANYKNERGVRKDGIRRTYGGVNASRVLDDYSFEQFDNDIDASGLLSVGLNIGQSSFTANTIASRVTSESVRVEDGFDGDELNESINWSIEWEERQFLSQQLAGEHILGADEAWTVNWQATASRAERYAPDRRDVRFDLQGNDGIYNLQVPELTRRYDDLVDDNLDASLDLEYLFSNGNLESKLEFGLNGITRERDSDSDTYGFGGGLLAIDDSAPNLQVSDVVNEDTITGVPSTGFTFQNKTLPSDSYEAELDLNSIYLSYDALWNLKYQMVVGVRYEEFEQVTDTFGLSGAQGPQQSVLEENSVLPSLSFNWFITDDQQLRFAVSKTVARPDFKETSNATFYDKEFNFRVRGNPNLGVSDVTNYDLRWEKYWSEQESLSIALFYKDMEDPIERVVQPASGTAGNSRTFQNAESAEILGIEIDGRKDFALNDAYTRSFFVATNASYVDSEVTLLNASKRELQGAPEYTFNLILGYDDIARGHELTLLLNQSGDTIVDVGVSGQPDVLLEPRLDVNLVYRYSLSDSFTFRAKLENILDSEVEFTQGGNVFQKYKRGFEVKAGFDWQF